MIMFSTKLKLCLPLNNTPLISISRSYRFGQRGMPGGYHVNPNWFDARLLEQTKPKSVVTQDGQKFQQNLSFKLEADRQKGLISRVEKIEVLLEKPFPASDDVILMMNAGISTPYDCAKHISQLIVERSALAVVDKQDYWHMHRPLERSCRLNLLHFKSDDVMPVNEAFWRSCSMLLGSVIKDAFKSDYMVEIISPLMSDIRTGSFICDVKISNLNDWKPTEEEKRIFTSLLWDQTKNDYPFERLEVDIDFAMNLFQNSTSHLKRLEDLRAKNTTKVTLYRVNEHIELCNEPLISRTSQIGSLFLSSIHPIRTEQGHFYRFQGIGLPKQLKINPYMFSLIRDRSEKLNSFGLN